MCYTPSCNHGPYNMLDLALSPALPPGRHVDDVLEAVLEAGAQHQRRIPTATLNMVVKEATAWKAPPTQRGSLRKGKIYYATQV